MRSVPLCVHFYFLDQIRKNKANRSTFVVTTLKALLPISKTNEWFSGRKFCAGYIDNLFWNIFAHNPSNSI